MKSLHNQEEIRNAIMMVLQSCGVALLECIEGNTAIWKVEQNEISYLVKFVSDEEVKTLHRTAKYLLAINESVRCDKVVILFHGMIPNNKLEYFTKQGAVNFLDAHTIGAHLTLLLDCELDRTEDEEAGCGHFALEGDNMHRSASMLVRWLLPEGDLQFSGSATYGNMRYYGPNLGFFEFITDNLKDGCTRNLFDVASEIQSQSAARYGNTVVFESSSGYSDNRYRAKITFTKYGLIVEEIGFEYSPFGHNVSLSGRYERAVFPSIERDRFYVSDAELEGLAHNFKGVFRSFQISPIEIRSWLNQFAPDERRSMLYLLFHVRFFNNLLVREAVDWLHTNTLKRFGLEERNEEKFLITAFGNPAKSGSTLARIYRSTNRLLTSNVAHTSDIKEHLERNSDLKFIICVEDVIGSGEDMVNFLRSLDSGIGSILSERGIVVIIQAVCALSDGVRKIEDEAKRIRFQYHLNHFELVDKCFSRLPEYRNIDEDWELIKSIAEKYGKRLRPDKPLGYGDSQMLVVFHDNCPNNTLPILWASSHDVDAYWTPLFPRE